MGQSFVLVELMCSGVKRQRSTCDKCSIYIQSGKEREEQGQNVKRRRMWKGESLREGGVVGVWLPFVR